jgi:hypothetical protein
MRPDSSVSRTVVPGPEGPRFESDCTLIKHFFLMKEGVSIITYGEKKH